MKNISFITLGIDYNSLTIPGCINCSFVLVFHFLSASSLSRSKVKSFTLRSRFLSRSSDLCRSWCVLLSSIRTVNALKITLPIIRSKAKMRHICRRSKERRWPPCRSLSCIRRDSETIPRARLNCPAVCTDKQLLSLFFRKHLENDLFISLGPKACAIPIL